MNGKGRILTAFRGAFPRSNAGVKSTSFGITPLLIRLYIPSRMSFSVIGGGSANGSSLKFLGRIRFGLAVPPFYR